MRTLKLSEFWTEQPDIQRPPNFDLDGKQLNHPKKNAKHYVDSIWPKPQARFTEDHLEELLRNTHDRIKSPQELEADEVLRRIKLLKSRRSTGLDTLSNEYLKSVKDIILPHVKAFFEACIRLSYFPRLFKEAKIVLLKKFGKKQNEYRQPKGWRPIALLSCLGKVLEGLIADRLKKIVVIHDILPSTQYGGVPGKTTAQAIERLLLQVFDGWTRRQRRHSTAVKLDVKGAFNNVMIRKLLEALSVLGIPHWIIRMIFSFMQSRQMHIQSPGIPLQGPFETFVGVPQGSPMSSILFACFTCLLFRPFNSHIHTLPKQCDAVLVAYVDDFYLVVTSPSFPENNRLVAELVRKLQAIGRENGVEFDKYGGMHFYPWPDRHADGLDQKPDVPELCADGVWKKKRERKGKAKEEAQQDPKDYALEILGVMVDPQLDWDAHVEAIKKKVGTRKWHIERMFTSVKGPTWKRAIHAFTCKVLPIFTNGSTAWWFTNPEIPFSLSRRQINALESCYYQALRKVLGGHDNIAKRMLQKDSNLPSLEVYLESYTWTQRVRALARTKPGSPSPSPTPMPDLSKPGKRRTKLNPCEALRQISKYMLNEVAQWYASSDQADPQKWNDPVFRQKVVGRYFRKKRNLEMSAAWDKFRRIELQKGRRDAILYEEWGRRCLKYYDGLPRHLCSFLLCSRTGFGGFRKHTFLIKVSHTRYSRLESS